MDSAELLDILGNENRRRILRLLARKPCYVTEISEYLGVSPKAVIDHLRKLEDAGLVESRTDDQRRKYFSISRNLRLEVNVSPYEFGMKSAYPASTNLDVSRCRHISLNVQYGASDDAPEVEREHEESTGGEVVDDAETVRDTESDDAGMDDPQANDEEGERSTAEERVAGTHATDAADLAEELDELEDLQSELSLAQRWVHGRIADVQDRLCDVLDANGERRLHAAVLAAVAGGATNTEEISRSVEAPMPVVEECLSLLETRGVVQQAGDEWELARE
ncbi:ArsR/SmtB family transcription factor [Halorussus halophilus]|uniref:ArsR/SmtB family transcription factor n=1 Tax=Halorussus halophilus TaxID=2650975 RepID=UPI0013014E71